MIEFKRLSTTAYTHLTPVITGEIEEYKSNTITMCGLCLDKKETEQLYDELLGLAESLRCEGLIERPDLNGEIKKLTESITKARNELACLVPNPDEPNFSICLSAGEINTADERCLNQAYQILTDALKD